MESGWGLNGLGHASLQLGNMEKARSSLEESIAVARNIGNPGALIFSLLGGAILTASPFQNMAGINEPDPHLINAVRLLGAILPLNQKSHMFFWPGWLEIYERAKAQIRAIVRDDVWEKGICEGESLSIQRRLHWHCRNCNAADRGN